MKKFEKTMRLVVAVVAMLATCGATAQPNYRADIQKEKLNRGVIAVKTNDGHVAVSWRMTSRDADNVAFNVERNGVKLNDTPIVKSTFFVDSAPLNADATYRVVPVGGEMDGTYTLPATAPVGYLPIALQKPEGGVTPDGRKYDYEANDASVGDVDGDGEMEVILKWSPTNARDNAHDGFTGSMLFDCYKLNGTRLWRIDLGRNVRSGAHYIQFLVYDFDGDGKAEMIVKTADGTIDGTGKVIGDSTKDYRLYAAEVAADYAKNKDKIEAENERIRKMQAEYQSRSQGMDPFRMTDKEKKEMRRMWQRQNRMKRGTGRILEGPEYLTVFSGSTGEALCTIDYVPARGKSEDWGDDNANRCDRYLACVAYLDGVHPSAVMCRGYYTRATLAAFDWDGKQLRQRWLFDSYKDGNNAYSGQGNHNLRVADVDGDSFDEIVYGSCTIDHDGTGLYSTRLGHGDAMHMTCFDPKSRELQVWDCHENHRDGSTLRSAKTGEILMQTKCNFDNGRCMAADIDPTNPGVEMWSLADEGIFNMKGERVRERKNISVNFAVWWDGDLLRELLDRSQVSKFDWTDGETKVVTRFEGTTFINGTKQNPCLSGDIIGDWREEVLTRTPDNKELRLYVSDIPTDYRMNTLLEDIPYRLSIAAENVCYNQPPEVGFYLGPDETTHSFLR